MSVQQSKKKRQQNYQSGTGQARIEYSESDSQFGQNENIFLNYTFF